jgi:hypothetical protein
VILQKIEPGPCLAKTWISTAMDPKMTRLWVDAFDAVKKADGRHQNVQIYGSS